MGFQRGVLDRRLGFVGAIRRGSVGLDLVADEVGDELDAQAEAPAAEALHADVATGDATRFPLGESEPSIDDAPLEPHA